MNSHSLEIPFAPTPSEETSALSRREALAQAGKAGLVLALAATPLAALFTSGCTAIGTVVTPTPSATAEVLNFALLLERLEHDFYVQALQAPGLIPARDRAVFEQISKHEGAHVTFLTTGITAIRGNAENATKFDFTAGGRHRDIFSNYGTFLSVAQQFEDTGVAAYKGQAANLMNAPTLLTAALRIHSVEGRHAAEIRRLRGQTPWPNGGFDVPMTRAQVLAAVSPFIARTTSNTPAGTRTQG